MKLSEKKLARKLRKDGLSLNEIASQVNVAKSTVSLWVRDIVLSQKKIDRLKSKCNIPSHFNEKKSKVAFEQRLSYQNEGRNLAKDSNILHAIGCMLYWGEGSKSRSICGMSNSDPELLKLFIRFLKEIFSISETKISLHIHCYTGNGLSISDIETYWINMLGLPNSCLRKTSINKISKSSSRKKPKNKLIYGTAYIRIYNTSLVQKIYGGIQEYAGIQTSKWLD